MVLLAAHGFAWPHVALWLARRSTGPRRAETRNLMIDSALGGLWVAVMQFNLLPSVLLVTMLSIDKISIGGARLLARALGLFAGGCAVTSALLGFPIEVVTPMAVVVACVPFLVIYPLAISMVAYQLARQVSQQNRKLEELGRTDVLTGLANRRQGYTVAEVELERSFRTGRPATLMIVDLDHFKRINDEHGHPAGDAVLCAVAEVLRQCCRAIDTPARYGGDEFMLVLAETNIRGAEEVAERIRRKMQSVEIPGAPGVRCTLSLGAAEADRQIANVEVWIQQADTALYAAKAAGRDQFVAAT